MKIDNIVVESLNREHGKEVIKTFRELGVDTKNKQGTNSNIHGDIDRYYGVINGRFLNFTIKDVRESFAKIITLEQLKAMKDKSEFPKLMWVGDTLDEIESNKRRGLKHQQRLVFYSDELGFWAQDDSVKEVAYHWKHAQDIEEAPDPKQEEKPKVEFKGVLCMGDFQKNTMTFVTEGDMTLQAGRYLISKID